MIERIAVPEDPEVIVELDGNQDLEDGEIATDVEPGLEAEIEDVMQSPNLKNTLLLAMSGAGIFQSDAPLQEVSLFVFITFKDSHSTFIF